ncbi:MAG: TatD family hydrolase [Patescibacteria group bacterium]
MFKPEIIDIHAHLNFSAYDEDRSAVLTKTKEAGVGVINVGSKLETSQQAVALAEKEREGMWATVGLHPLHTAFSYWDKKELGEGATAGFTTAGEVLDIDLYRQLIKSSTKVVAIGEIGLDYGRSLSDKDRQKQFSAFESQLQLAQEMSLPVMLHIRGAYEDTLAILKNFPDLSIHTHFFVGSDQILKRFLDKGATISFTGVITFSQSYRQVVELVPLDSLMVETDCPYVSPVPYRGQRNEPLYVKTIAEQIATWRGLSYSELAEITTANAFRVFGLKE